MILGKILTTQQMERVEEASPLKGTSSRGIPYPSSCLWFRNSSTGELDWFSGRAKRDTHMETRQR